MLWGMQLALLVSMSCLLKQFQILILISLLPFMGHAQGAGRCELVFGSSGAVESEIQNFLDDTLKGFEKLRGENGLVTDTVWIQAKGAHEFQIQTLNPDTSPTNIAVDLLIQAELLSGSHKTSANAVLAGKNISKVLSVLENVSFHQDTGLFFTRYSTDSQSRVKDASVSSIDNLHLAIALWTVKENFPKSELGIRAGRLFDRMNFSVYYEASSGLIGGNLKYEDGHWKREAYNFANLGSEARSLYGAGWALGLFRGQKNEVGFVKKSLSSLKAEIYKSPEGRILKLWDGSAFQLFFPKIFISEELYSPEFNSFYKSAGHYMVAEGQRRGLNVPAAHSAVRAALAENSHQPTYKDKAGNKKLVSSDNKDLIDIKLRKNWDSTFSPYALMMAATSNPKELMPLFSEMKNFKSGEDLFYRPEMGWMEALEVKGHGKGQVVPAQISLNQGMIALSLFQMQAPDGLSLSGRSMYKNKKVRNRLEEFYKMADEKLVQAH